MKRKETKKNGEQRELTVKLMRRYIVSLVLYAVSIIVPVWLAWKLLHQRIWYVTDPLWPLLNLLDENVFLLGGIIFVAGAAVITWNYFKRALGYLDEVVQVSERLALLPEDTLFLSPELRPVQDRLNEAREKALHHARAAKEAEQRKNDLIVYLAHDLKTPLTSVIGYLTLLHDEPDLPLEMRARYTGIVYEKAERLQELIDEFFDITRFNLTAIELNKQWISLSRMLEQIQSEFLPLFKEKNLVWEGRIEPSVNFLCDPDKMERVFDNLIRNVVNYSYDGTPVRCDLCCEENNIRISISNRGMTIAKEKLSRIFEQFFRVDSSRSSASGGAGLGLAIAREIVELHGGSIGAESSDERVTFTIILPTAQPEKI